MRTAKWTQDRRREEGKCLGCENPAEPGRSYCVAHLQANREYARRVRKERKAKGLCQECGKRKAKGGTRCPACCKKGISRRNEARVQSLCTICGKAKASEGHRICDPCRSKTTESQRRRGRVRIAAGECVKCMAKTEDGRRHCPSCLEQRKRAMDRFREAGVCPNCRGAGGQGKVYCEDCLAILRVKNRERLLKQKLEVFDQYGGCRCACCGESSLIFLTIDHVEGGGAAHRRMGVFPGNHLYRWLKRNKWPQGFQVLCFNCNFAKHHLGRCPHADHERTPDGNL